MEIHPDDSMELLKTIAGDPNHWSLSTSELMSEFSNSTPFPRVHGFIQPNSSNKFGACYSFEPKSNWQHKVIVPDNWLYCWQRGQNRQRQVE